MEAPTAVLRVAVTGASGLVGRALSERLQAAGHRVHPMVRRDARPDSDEIAWDPEGEVDRAALEGVDAVVHLAGESIFGLWTRKKKERIRRSRVEGTRVLAEALASLERKPRVLVSTSGVGYYGDRGDEVLTEDSDPGTDFLAEVGMGWEAAAGPARDAGIRVVHPRVGVVLSPSGGALATMLPVFRMGLGGPLGSGRQWFSWIAREDLVGILERLIGDEGLEGPVNAVAPEPVRHREFVETLGRVLGRPTVLGAPAFGVRLALGELADVVLLGSQRVVPRRLQAAGFSWRHPELEPALRALLQAR